jgi:hypothetical protein
MKDPYFTSIGRLESARQAWVEVDINMPGLVAWKPP